jgi:hypothetical protein
VYKPCSNRELIHFVLQFTRSQKIKGGGGGRHPCRNRQERVDDHLRVFAVFEQFHHNPHFSNIGCSSTPLLQIRT